MPFVQKLLPCSTAMLPRPSPTSSPSNRLHRYCSSSGGYSGSSGATDHGGSDAGARRLKRIQTDHRELRSQIAEQNTSLKRVEDHLELVREATDRNTLEQQELMEDLKSVGTKVNVVTLAVLAMLLASMLLNLILYLHIQRVLP